MIKEKELDKTFYEIQVNRIYYPCNPWLNGRR